MAEILSENDPRKKRFDGPATQVPDVLLNVPLSHQYVDHLVPPALVDAAMRVITFLSVDKKTLYIPNGARIGVFKRASITMEGELQPKHFGYVALSDDININQGLFTKGFVTSPISVMVGYVEAAQGQYGYMPILTHNLMASMKGSLLSLGTNVIGEAMTALIGSFPPGIPNNALISGPTLTVDKIKIPSGTVAMVSVCYEFYCESLGKILNLSNPQAYDNPLNSVTTFLSIVGITYPKMFSISIQTLFADPKTREKLEIQTQPSIFRNALRISLNDLKVVFLLSCLYCSKPMNPEYFVDTSRKRIKAIKAGGFDINIEECSVTVMKYFAGLRNFMEVNRLFRSKILCEKNSITDEPIKKQFGMLTSNVDTKTLFMCHNTLFNYPIITSIPAFSTACENLAVWVSNMPPNSKIEDLGITDPEYVSQISVAALAALPQLCIAVQNKLGFYRNMKCPMFLSPEVIEGYVNKILKQTAQFVQPSGKALTVYGYKPPPEESSEEEEDSESEIIAKALAKFMKGSKKKKKTKK